jgi:hypothetical protein
MITVLAMSVAMVASPQTGMSPEMALSIAQAIANYAGYPPNNMEYEITDKPGRPAVPGFITVQVRNTVHPAYNLSINTETGQVADFLFCHVFEYPVIRRVEGDLGFMAHGKIGYSKMMGDNGCDKYTVYRRAGDEGRDLPEHSTD